MTPTAPGLHATPTTIDGETEWLPARVPGTVADALRDAGSLNFLAPEELDDRDWWFATRIEGEGIFVLRFDGLATIADIFLDDTLLMRSSDMYLSSEIEVVLSGSHRLSLCFRALAPVLAQTGKRARWRPKLASPQTLRLARTTFLGRMGGWQPPIHAIGPWRDVTITAARPRVVAADLRARCEGANGALEVSLRLEGVDAPTARLRCGAAEAAMTRVAPGEYHGLLIVENVERWWPHTHGEPRLYAVEAHLGAHVIDLGRAGFRDVAIKRGADGRGFDILINGERIFCRGALWTTSDLASLSGARESIEPLLRRMREAHMNMVRVGGTTVYESDAFYRTCDELGLLVWQDFMFSNFDYPAADAEFVALVDREARDFLDRTQSSPSIIFLCGASEVAQQAAMMGLPAPTWTNPIFDDVLRVASAEARPDAIYIAHTPFGGALPFEPASGVCHYYGVSAYMRPIEDARQAGVRFAAECLGFANPPEGPVALEPDRAAIVQPCWGERHERDVGATWFFEDVRNHYLRELYRIDPEALRRDDPDGYLDLSRAVNAELMEDVFALWRRTGSPTAGGLVWFLRDVTQGAGFGVLDSHNRPKSVYHALRRAFRPVQLLLTDDGLNGVHAHLVNETSVAVDATLSLACLREGATPVMRARREMTLAPRSSVAIPATDLWGGFFDTGYTYRFGPPSHDATVARLTGGNGDVLAEAFHFPLGRDAHRHELGLTARLEQDGAGWSLALSCARLAQSVRIVEPLYIPDDNWFHLAPGEEKRVRLISNDVSMTPSGDIRAINGIEHIHFGERT